MTKAPPARTGDDCPHCGKVHANRPRLCPATGRKMPMVLSSTDDEALEHASESDAGEEIRTTGDPFAASSLPAVTLRFEWGQVVELGEGDVLEIGRDRQFSALAARMTDNISSRHCRITVNDGTVTVTDLCSTNGTFVDGRRIEPLVPVVVTRECRLGADPPVLIAVSGGDGP